MQYNKETIKQWWEYLKLSKDYPSICELVSKCRVNAPEFPLRRLLDELNRNEKFRPINKYLNLLAVYEKFGDVHQNNFEDWWGNYNQPKSVKTRRELDVYKEEKYRRINLDMEDEQLQSYIEIWEKIIYFPDLYTRIEPYVNLNRPLKDINSDMRNFIKEEKQNAEKSKREVSEREEYLRILSLFLEGNSIPQIIDRIGSKKEKDKTRPEYENVLRSYQNKRSKAELILSHVEEGKFP